MSEAEDELAFYLRACRITGWVRELRFAPPRRWRFDFAFPEPKIAVEVDGGAWTRGRHTRGAGLEADNEKFAAAVIAGWRVIHVTPGQVRSGQATAWVEDALRVNVKARQLLKDAGLVALSGRGEGA